MQIALILADDHPWRQEAESVGHVVLDGSVSDLAGLARVPVDALLLDASALVKADLEAVRSYRIARPETRIITFVPAEAKPGDPIAAGLVALGVYDLSTGSLDQALAHHATFADAVRWQTQTVIAPTLKERRSLAAGRPALIVVAGGGYGVGTTTLARLVGETVTSQGHHAVVIDAAIMPGASRLGGPLPVVRVPPAGGHLPLAEIEAEIGRRSSGFVIVDGGRLGESQGLVDLARSADLLLMAVPPAPHRLGWLEAALEPLTELARVRTAWVLVGGSETAAAATAVQVRGMVGGQVSHLPLSAPGPAVAALLGKTLLPEGSAPGLFASLRWRVLSLPAVSGSVVHLLATVARQAAFVVGRLAGVLIVAAALALIAAVVMPVFGHVNAIGQVAAWVGARWQALMPP